MRKERLTFIDITRGMCIILVVIGHYIPIDAPTWYLRIRDIIYSFHMPLFMFLSGLVYFPPKNYKSFITKKFRRLMVPYFLISFLIIGIKLVAEGGLSVENPVTVASFYELFYLPSAGFFLWFVYVLFMIFLIVPFFQFKYGDKLLLALSFVLLLFPVEFTDLFCLAQFKRFLFYFALGAFFSTRNTFKEKGRFYFLFPALLLFGVFYTLGASADFVFPPILDNLISMATAVSGIAVVVYFSLGIDVHKNCASIKNLFLRLALYSYTIYLFHTSFQGVAKALFAKLPLENYLSDMPLLFLSLLVVNLLGIVGPIILYRIDEKWKLTRYL